MTDWARNEREKADLRDSLHAARERILELEDEVAAVVLHRDWLKSAIDNFWKPEEQDWKERERRLEGEVARLKLELLREPVDAVRQFKASKEHARQLQESLDLQERQAQQLWRDLRAATAADESRLLLIRELQDEVDRKDQSWSREKRENIRLLRSLEDERRVRRRLEDSLADLQARGK